MQPLKFESVLKQTLWGGDKIIPFKNIDSDMTQVGESWEISGVKGSETVVKEGPYKGKRLNEVVNELKEKLVGGDNYKEYGSDFPLLIKFIDARQDLSIQVHPNDEIAHLQGKEHGKTEMWYVMKSDADAKLRAGLKKSITHDEYKEMVENDTITDVIAEFPVKEGDCFFIPPGRIHSIGAGCLLAEIQQTSDVTYRIYDFKRKDKNGNYRQLHTKEAAESIDYNVYSNYKITYVPSQNQGVELVRCPHFNTAVYDLTEPMMLDYSELDSFVIFVGLSGKGSLIDNEGNEVTICEGEALLIPATTDTIRISGSIKFLETYI
jgi:mannose-6-phosphate isomerase